MDKKIVSKDKSYIYLQPNGSVWHSVGKPGAFSFSCCANIVNHVCNPYRQYTVPQTKYGKYWIIHIKLLRFAEKFKIKKLRLFQQKVVKGKYGDLLEVSYGYVDKSKFEHLLHKRRTVNEDGYNTYICLKESDAEWKSE